MYNFSTTKRGSKEKRSRRKEKRKTETQRKSQKASKTTPKHDLRLGVGFIRDEQRGLAAAADGAGDNIKLLFASELDEVHGVARYANGELRIFLGVFHCIVEQVAVEDVHIEVLTTVGSEVAVHEIDEVFHLLSLVLTECGGRDGPSIGDTVV